MDEGGGEEALQQTGQADSDGENSKAGAKPLADTSRTRSRDEMLEENVIGTLARGFQVTVRADTRYTWRTLLSA
jgi:hypothetical protein|eukprot:COSAG02_NODE_3121_length_7326_cov_29.940501_4_plen_74_part_00